MMDSRFGKENQFLNGPLISNVRISDFCDMQQFDQMMKDWAFSTGLATVAVGNDGEYISGYYNFTDFCEKLTRKSPEGLRRCVECDKKGVGIYKCHAGLVDFATPITLVDGTVLGSIVGGQVLPLKPDEAKFRTLAGELGIDADTYIAALKNVNVKSRREIEASAHLLGNVINMFVRSSYAAYLNTTSLVRRAHIISSLSRIYFCSYYIDAGENSYIELDATDRLRSYSEKTPGASELIRATCEAFIEPACRKAYLEFTDLHTLQERMGDSESLSFEFSCLRIGWCRGIFIRIEHDEEEGFHVIYAIQSIQKEKENDLAVRRELEKAAEDANQANRAKTDFLTRMSHDIRTPLNGIIGMNYLAMRETASPEVKEHLSKVDVSSKFLLELINDILDMSKAESGKITLHPEPYPVGLFNQYIEAVIMPLCRQKDIHFTLTEQVSGDRAPVVDKARINQILFNVLSNAVKYTPAGGEVTYRISSKALERDEVEIEHVISDSGIGMSEEFQKKMFEPFSRENISADNVVGSGLGLAIVKKLVDLMDGTIHVTSAVGKGTTVTLRFRFPTVEEGKNAEEPEASRSSDNEILKGKRLLLCEDNGLNTEIACELLKTRGASADCATNGQAGLEMFRDSAPGTYAAILMDIRMPVMNGIDAARAIRSLAREDAGTIPIIAMTANAFSEDVRNCLDAGMNAFIAKPVDPPVMFRTIEETIGR
jgi:signal transduction histidine kinase/ligand-binding sensor protein/ActR/RegA family two-component response regulator